MNLPTSLHFLRPGWWILHLVAITGVGALGFSAGVHLSGAHGHDERQAHGHDEGHAHGHAEPPPEPAGPATNPVQVEMRLLEGALATAPARFAAADLRPLEHALHMVHAAREKTDEALEKGTYRPPSNADKLARFRELDAQFHADLEKLVEHAAKNELAPAATAYGRVLGACNGCHSEFRTAR